MNDSTDNDLKTMLETWSYKPAHHPGFNREVWQKLAARESARRRFSLPAAILKLFASPQYATALVLVMLTLSVSVARLQSRSANSRHWAQLQERYMDSIDPLAHSGMK